MADQVENFLFDLSERHIHNDNLNIIEYLKRRLNDSYTALCIIVMHCMEQNICHEVIEKQRETLHRLSTNVERYNELCDSNIEGRDAMEISSTLTF